jgi:hypothetical protein
MQMDRRRRQREVPAGWRRRPQGQLRSFCLPVQAEALRVGPPVEQALTEVDCWLPRHVAVPVCAGRAITQPIRKGYGQTEPRKACCCGRRTDSIERERC